MVLSDLSMILTGKSSQNKAVALFFPNIKSEISTGLNIMGIDMNNYRNLSSATIKRIISFSFAKGLRKNSSDTALIENLIKLSKNEKGLNSVFVSYENSVYDIEDYCLHNHKCISDCFRECLILIDRSGLVDIEYLNVINNYILNERYDIVLFLMGTLLILSSAIRDKDNFTDNDNKEVKKAIEVMEDIKNYKKYIIGNKTPLYEEYIPIKQEPLDFIKNEIQSDTITVIKEKTVSTSPYSNTREPLHRNYFETMLRDISCKEIHILSRFANAWSNGEVYELLTERLEKSNLIVKMLLMDITTSFAYVYNDSQNHISVNPAQIFERLSMKFPENFYLKYITIPLTNGIVQDVSNRKLRVDYLMLPPISNKRLIHYFNMDNPYEKLYYQQYSEQFDMIWNEYSRKPEISENIEFK